MTLNPVHPFSLQLIAAIEARTSIRPIEYVERHSARDQFFYLVIEIYLGEKDKGATLCYSQVGVLPIGPQLEGGWRALREFAYREIVDRDAITCALKKAV